MAAPDDPNEKARIVMPKAGEHPASFRAEPDDAGTARGSSVMDALRRRASPAGVPSREVPVAPRATDVRPPAMEAPRPAAAPPPAAAKGMESARAPSIRERLFGRAEAGPSGDAKPAAPAAPVAAPAAAARGGRRRPHGTNHPLLTDLEHDEPGSPPQRGSIPQDKFKRMRLQMDVADKIRGVIAPSVSLDLPLERSGDLELKANELLAGYLRRYGAPPGAHEGEFRAAVLDETFGYGPLDPFIRDSSITEIMVNGPFIVFIEHKGKLLETGHKFADDDHVVRMIRRIVLPLGRLVSPDAPLIDARLPDGSRVNATLRPCAIDGPNLTIRKFSREKLTIQNLIDFSSLSDDMARFLEALVVSRQNIIVSGGTGSGKTTLINCLSAYIPDEERVVTIEDAAELQLKQRHVVRLETKKPTPESPTEVNIRNCVVNSLRMRPERIVVGECRAGEALDMLQAMNTGHDGSMTTVHANNPRACISRLETLCLMSGIDLPILVVRKQICTAVNWIVQTSRLRDGTRKVTHITEIERMEGDVPILNDVFVYAQKDNRQTGQVEGFHTATGTRPVCESILRKCGFEFPNSVFTPSRPLR